MGPMKKSRSVNKRYSTNEASPSKDGGEGAKGSNNRKRKLTDRLGPRWSMEELTRFYESYRKNGKDWKKVAGVVRHRSSEMVEALYTMNRAYLSLPHGTASAAGLIAMMTDHYSNLAGSDGEEESTDGVGSSRKTQKPVRSEVQPTASKASDEQLASHASTIVLDYGCLSQVLKKKRSGGSRPRPVKKRTLRIPVSLAHDEHNGEKCFSPSKQSLKLKPNADDDDVAHEIAIALAEASQRGGSPQVSVTPTKRGESVISSPFRHAHIKHSVAVSDNSKLVAAYMDEEELEGRAKAETGELSMIESARGAGGKKIEIDSNNESHLDDIKEESSGTEEGQRLGEMTGKCEAKVNDAKFCKSNHCQRKKSTKVLFSKDEGTAFDALRTLADLSLMLPTENEDESMVHFKDEHDGHVDESEHLEVLTVIQPREKRRSSGVRTKGHTISSSEVASSKTSKLGKGSVFYASFNPEENPDLHQSSAKSTRKKQKILVSKIEKPESHPDTHVGESPGLEARETGRKIPTKSKKLYQSSSLNLMKIQENPSSADLPKEGSDSTLSSMQGPVVNQVSLTPTRSRRKTGLIKPQPQKDLKFAEVFSNGQSNKHLCSSHDTASNVKGNMYNCLLNQILRRWCTYEWFYSAIDYPWFAKREFVEYLYHVGLGHVPRLTRVEWGVIRSSLGKPRRFSEQFLKEEKEKLNQYRESVRNHYTELREGVREGLPTDLAKPLSVGQRVVAIHPRTREIHDGSVLTVDHSKCRVQFDRHELGVEFVMDIDCMPSNPFENMPALLGRSVAVDKFSENFSELKVNGRANDCLKLLPNDDMDNINGTPHLSPLPNPASLLKQTKFAAPSHIRSKETDVQALAELTRALDKKEAIVLELRRMNEDVLENQNDGDSPLKDTEHFKKQYAAVLIQLNETNERVSSALHWLRERNTYQEKGQLTRPRPISNFSDPSSVLNSFGSSSCQTHESGSHVNEIMDSSRTKARIMVDAAMQAISSLKHREDTIEKVEQAIDYVNEQLPSDDSYLPVPSDPKSMNSLETEEQLPTELITRCVATLLMFQKCTERQFPPSDVAQILDSAVTSLQPLSSQNLPVYTEIQKCVGIIKNQILALIPT